MYRVDSGIEFNAMDEELVSQAFVNAHNMVHEDDFSRTAIDLDIPTDDDDNADGDDNDDVGGPLTAFGPLRPRPLARNAIFPSALLFQDFDTESKEQIFNFKRQGGFDGIMSDRATAGRTNSVR